MRRYLALAALAFACGLPASAFAEANPASAFCREMGGRLEIATLASGDEIGLCILENRQIVEEWTLFRMFDGQVPTDDDNPFL